MNFLTMQEAYTFARHPELQLAIALHLYLWPCPSLHGLPPPFRSPAQRGICGGQSGVEHSVCLLSTHSDGRRVVRDIRGPFDALHRSHQSKRSASAFWSNEGMAKGVC
jgi:hypothetical protein